MRRFATLALSLSMLLGLVAAGRLAAQDEKKGEAKPAPADPAKTQEKDKAKEAEKEGTKGEETPPPMQTLTPGAAIPPEVEQKLEAARRAVAEAIVAAQDAGLVDTTISPPPVLDILVLGRVDDKTTLKGVAGKAVEAGVSPEVFGAWFTGFGQLEGVNAEKNVRVVPPSKGLKAYYDTRATLFNRYIDEARKAKGAAPKEGEGTPKPAGETPKPAEEPKKGEETKPAEAPKDEAKPADEPKKTDEPKPAEEKKDEAPKDEAKPAPAEEKKEEPKAEEKPAEDKPAEDKPGEEPK